MAKAATKAATKAAAKASVKAAAKAAAKAVVEPKCKRTTRHGLVLFSARRVQPAQRDKHTRKRALLQLAEKKFFRARRMRRTSHEHARCVCVCAVRPSRCSGRGALNPGCVQQYGCVQPRSCWYGRLHLPNASVRRERNCTQLHATARNCTQLHATARNCTQLHVPLPPSKPTCVVFAAQARYIFAAHAVRGPRG